MRRLNLIPLPAAIWLVIAGLAYADNPIADSIARVETASWSDSVEEYLYGSDGELLGRRTYFEGLTFTIFQSPDGSSIFAPGLPQLAISRAASGGTIDLTADGQLAVRWTVSPSLAFERVDVPARFSVRVMKSSEVCGTTDGAAAAPGQPACTLTQVLEAPDGTELKRLTVPAEAGNRNWHMFNLDQVRDAAGLPVDWWYHTKVKWNESGSVAKITDTSDVPLFYVATDRSVSVIHNVSGTPLAYDLDVSDQVEFQSAQGLDVSYILAPVRVGLSPTKGALLEAPFAPYGALQSVWLGADPTGGSPRYVTRVIGPVGSDGQTEPTGSDPGDELMMVCDVSQTCWEWPGHLWCTVVFYMCEVGGGGGGGGGGGCVDCEPPGGGGGGGGTQVDRNHDGILDCWKRSVANYNPTSATNACGQYGATSPPCQRGHTHRGQDVAAPCGSQVRAPVTGVVDDVGPNGSHSGMGNYIRLRTPSGHYVVLMHLQHDLSGTRPVGSQVTVGEPLGRVGRTGCGGCGCHLHLQAQTVRWPTSLDQTLDPRQVAGNCP